MKQKLRQFKILLFIGMLMGSGGLSAGEIKSDVEAVSSMGKLRMLSWRTLKNHVEIGMDSNYGDPKQELEATVAEFDGIVKGLDGYVKDPKVKEKLNTIKEKWQGIKHSLGTKLTLSEAGRYHKSIVALIKIANGAVGTMAKGGHAVIGKASKLRAVSSSLSALYLLKAWGMKGAGKPLARTMKSFRSSLDFLKKDPATGPEMTKIIQKLEKTYMYFQVMNGAETMTPSLAIKKTNSMFKDADALTQLYANKLK